jgi:hypothetical protein
MIKSTRSELDIKVDESKISETEWKCQDCGRIFGRRDKLKNHYRLLHMDDRPYMPVLSTLRLSHRRPF